MALGEMMFFATLAWVKRGGRGGRKFYTTMKIIAYC